MCLGCFVFAGCGTEIGSAIRATGSNFNISRAQSINTSFNKVLGIMLSNGLVEITIEVYNKTASL